MTKADAAAKDAGLADSSNATVGGSMLDAIQKSRKEGSFGESVRGVGCIKSARKENSSAPDFNDYKPVQRFCFDDTPVGVVTVNHELARNIIGLQFESRVVIFKLERGIHQDEEYFQLTKLQQFAISPNTSMRNKIPKMVTAFSINPSSNLSSLGEQNLMYAVSYEGDSFFYVVSETTEAQFSPIKTFPSEYVTVFDGHRASVRHLAFDAEHGELLASLSDNADCILWGVATHENLIRISLQSPGIACLWHKSEPYKLLIIEQGGTIRMYNTLKQQDVITVNTFVQPIYSADWSSSNSQIVGVGANKCAYLFDLSRLNSEPGRRVDTHFGATNTFKFSSIDNQQFSTAIFSPRGEIKSFQKNFRNCVWSQKHPCIQGLGWIYGEPYQMALVGKEMLIYESIAV